MFAGCGVGVAELRFHVAQSLPNSKIGGVQHSVVGVLARYL